MTDTDHSALVEDVRLAGKQLQNRGLPTTAQACWDVAEAIERLTAERDHWNHLADLDARLLRAKAQRNAWKARAEAAEDELRALRGQASAELGEVLSDALHKNDEAKP